MVVNFIFLNYFSASVFDLKTWARSRYSLSRSSKKIGKGLTIVIRTLKEDAGWVKRQGAALDFTFTSWLASFVFFTAFVSRWFCCLVNPEKPAEKLSGWSWVQLRWWCEAGRKVLGDGSAVSGCLVPPWQLAYLWTFENSKLAFTWRSVVFPWTPWIIPVLLWKTEDKGSVDIQEEAVDDPLTRVFCRTEVTFFTFLFSVCCVSACIFVCL